MRLFILYEEEIPLRSPHWMDTEPSHQDSQYTWSGHEVINFGRVTRLEKLINRKQSSGLAFSPHERAGICAMSCLLGHLFAKLNASPKDVIAPPVPLNPHSREEIIVHTRDDLRAPVIDASRQMVMEHELSYRQDERTLIPKHLAQHNLIHGLSMEEIRVHLESTHLIVDQYPFLWESCATMASWLQRAEEQQSDEWTQLVDHPRSLALFRGWRAYLKEVGTVGARALVLFS